MVVEYEFQFDLEALLLTFNITLTLIVMLGACLCCKKKVPKNDLLGLEGMVKLKNPDEVIVVVSNNVASNSLVRNSESQAELNASTVSNADSEKRSSTAAHRSLPDIPVAESNDNGSELYETVADKQLVDARHARSQSPQPSLKKQTSVSQHSSISQADDVSSPYSRVKDLPHDYAKVRTTEHPYAQLNAPSTSGAAAPAVAASNSNANASTSGADALHRSSQHNNCSAQQLNDALAPQSEIPAASAIAGMISASQDLPYMTPPIANQHFSGDSQDSSKGYTSISVREPLANILAQQPGKPAPRNATLSRDVNDSHYATVSDDSDETYAAIEDPNNRHIPNATDIYTSGSETYAQIQPMQLNPIVVAVEINNSSMQSASPAPNCSHSSGANSTQLNHNAAAASTLAHRPNSSSNADHAMPVPPPVDSLRAQMHSRQASSSSNNSSSVCNLGSPKPEKRQANSPLPPTPKSTGQTLHLHGINSSSSNLTSGRNSVISVIEAGGAVGAGDANDTEANESSPQRKHSKSLSSPSKDIEGMYAKVMKKHKFSRNSPSSQHSSPIMTRKQQHESIGVSHLDSAAAQLMDAAKISLAGDRSRARSNSYSAKDHGYETIPAEGHGHAAILHENRKSDCYASNMLQKERQRETATAQTHTNAKATAATSGHPRNSHMNHNSNSSSEKHYETIVSPPPARSSSSNNDPGYEQLQPHHQPDDDAKKSEYDPNYEVLKSRAHSDDGYAKVLEKKRAPNALDSDAVDSSGGYSTIPNADANHNYASILETKAAVAVVAAVAAADTETDHYARIAESTVTTPGSALTSPASLNSSSLITTVTMSTSSISSRQTPLSSQYESLTGSETDPNYESVCYLNTTTTSSSSTGTGGGGSSTDHAYERLHTELSDTQASSPLTPEALSSTPSEVVVDDYFQV